MPCTDIGPPNPDIAGIGVLTAFMSQAAVSLVLSFWSFALDRRNPEDVTAAEKEESKKKQEIINKILLLGSDAQTLNGIGLLLAVLVQRQTIPLYHFHLIYDTINFTGVSNCAAISCTIPQLKTGWLSRYLAISFYMILYLAFCISFGMRLSGWDESVPGQCYNTSAISRPQDSHPAADIVYLAITCFYFVATFLAVALASIPRVQSAADRLKNDDSFSGRLLASVIQITLDALSMSDISYRTLSLAAVQFPLHLWSMIALRVTNQPLLADHSENTWGFGQIISVVMVAGILIECFKGFKEYRRWKQRNLRDSAGI